MQQASAHGRRRLPASRRFIVDYLSFARKVPSQAIRRMCDVSDLWSLRSSLQARVGWSAVMVKAYATMAERHPQLRASLMQWPWLHLFGHARQIGRLTLTRHYNGEDWLFFLKVEQPETKSLREIQAEIDHAKTAPVDEIPQFRQRILFSKLPTILRRIVWWSALNLSGRLRASAAGTFGMTTIAALKVTSIHPPTLGNIVFTCGPVNDGAMSLTFVYDHRVFDGNTVAGFMADFESVLHHEITQELVLQREAELQRQPGPRRVPTLF